MAEARWRRWALLVVVVVIALYLQSCLAVFGFYDDHVTLWEASQGRGYFFELMLTSGRPLNGLLTEPLFLAADTISDLRWIRALGVLGVVGTALALLAVGRRAGFGPVASAAIAVSVAAMPSTVILSTWAVAAWQLPALAGGVVAGLLLTYRSVRGDVAAALLLTVSLSIYQPSALAVVPVFLFVALGRLPEPVPWLRALIAGAAGCVMYAVTTGLAVWFFEAEAAERATLPTSWSRKLRWFTVEALPQTLDPLHFDPVPSAIALTGVVFAGGLWFALAAHPVRTRVTMVAAVAAGWVLTCAWVIVVDQDSMNHRIRLANHLMFVLVGATALRGYASVASRRTVAAFAGVGVLLVVGTAGWRLDRYIVSPRVEERELVVSMIEDADIAGERVVVLPADREDSLAPRMSHWEYGWLSTADPPSAAAMVRLLADGEPASVLVLKHGREPIGFDGKVIDFTELPERHKAMGRG